MNIEQILADHKAWLDTSNTGKRAYLRGADLSNADLRDADLRDADLCRANLRCANLNNANLSGADLCRVNLRSAYLSNANLSGADLSCADLRGANLSGADLSNTYLCHADLCRVNLSNADLSGVRLNYCMGNSTQIKTIQTAAYTITYTATDMAIGCQQHSIEKWFKFSDAEIASMAIGALEWWKKWKPILKLILEVE